MNYLISVEANNDLEKIWYYTFNTWSIEQADRYINQIFEEIEYVSLKPKTGKDYSFIREGYFRTKVKSHFIFYRINRDNILEVIRILYQRMDIENRLND